MPTSFSTFKSETNTIKSINTLIETTRRLSHESTYRQSNDIHEELTKIQWPLLKCKKVPPIVKPTPKVFITPESSSEQVQHWLQAKGFSEKIIKQLEPLNGQQVMSFTEKDFETLELRVGCEAKRLVSQITLQKEVCGVSTSI